MTKAETLLALAERVALAGPDREVDARVYCAISGRPYPEGPAFTVVDGDDGQPPFQHVTHAGILRQSLVDASLPYTASRDAADTLAPVGWFLRVEPRFYSDDGQVRWRAYAIKPDWSRWTPHDDWFEVIGPVEADKAPAAMTAAALRALASSETQHDG